MPCLWKKNNYGITLLTSVGESWFVSSSRLEKLSTILVDRAIPLIFSKKCPVWVFMINDVILVETRTWRQNNNVGSFSRSFRPCFSCSSCNFGYCGLTLKREVSANSKWDGGGGLQADSTRAPPRKTNPVFSWSSSRPLAGECVCLSAFRVSSWLLVGWQLLLLWCGVWVGSHFGSQQTQREGHSYTLPMTTTKHRQITDQAQR